jgi:hypothetical protein
LESAQFLFSARVGWKGTWDSNFVIDAAVEADEDAYAAGRQGTGRGVADEEDEADDALEPDQVLYACVGGSRINFLV